jgi:HD-like signal output (HDOD) protein
VKNFAQYLNNLPVNPDVAAKVLNMVESKDFSFQALEDSIKIDPGLTMKILRIANSALYARPKGVTQLQTAITLLGLKTIKSLVILATGASIFPNSKRSPFYTFFWKHSIVTAFVARDLAILINKKNLADDAFIAGLLHNIGQVAFYFADPVKYEALLAVAGESGQRISLLEQAQYDSNHKEVGYDVLTGWNFPTVYTDTAREHGNNHITSEHKQVIILVSTADFLTSNFYLLKDRPEQLSLLQPYLPFLGMTVEGLEQFQKDCLNQLSTDKLFLECHNLFGIPA